MLRTEHCCNCITPMETLPQQPQQKQKKLCEKLHGDKSRTRVRFGPAWLTFFRELYVVSSRERSATPFWRYALQRARERACASSVVRERESVTVLC